MPSKTSRPGRDRRTPYNVVIAADGEPRTHRRQGNKITARVPAGGVSVALDRVSQQTGATFVTRAKSEEDLEVLNGEGKVTIRGRDGSYTLKRLELSEDEVANYYFGYSNQSLWPLFHSTVDRIVVSQDWHRGYVDVNRRFAQAIEPEVHEQSLVWINDYQLAMVPSFLQHRKDTTVALFWHIPWPGPEILRRLPDREELLRSFLCCDVVGFHTEEYARNFLQAVNVDLGATIDEQNLVARFEGNEVRALVLPLGIDTDAIRSVVGEAENGCDIEGDAELGDLCRSYSIMLGVDRLDYSKGIPQRLMAIDRLFERYPEYRGKAVYVGIMSPTRETIPAYQQIKAEVMDLEKAINEKYGDETWKPLHLRYDGLPRPDVLRLYTEAAVCLVTSVADGMNLVAKEFVVAASCVRNPGMLVLSEFAGAAEDLSGAIIVNPHDLDGTAEGVYAALRMPRRQKRAQIAHMAQRLEREDVYTWAQNFLAEAMGTRESAQHRVA